MKSVQKTDEELIREVKGLIDEVIDKVPQRRCMDGAFNLSSLIIFSLGCIIGFELFVFNLFLTSIVILSVFLLLFFFTVGFLLGIFIEKTDTTAKLPNPIYSKY